MCCVELSRDWESILKSRRPNQSKLCLLNKFFSNLEIKVEKDHLGEQLGEVLKKIGTVEITVIVNIELSNKARDSPQLHNRLKGHFLHFIGHLWVL